MATDQEQQRLLQEELEAATKANHDAWLKVAPKAMPLQGKTVVETPSDEDMDRYVEAHERWLLARKKMSDFVNSSS